MTTNHPAHGPVSLDRLHQIREILSKASAQSDGGNLGYAMADAVKVIDGAIAEFGVEPQRNPVLAYADSYRDMAKRGVESIPVWSVITDLERNIAPLYTAPTAQVVPTFDEWLAIRGNKPLGWVKDAMRESYDACRAAMLQAGNSPVAPDGWIPVSERMPGRSGVYMVWNGKHIGAVSLFFGSFQCIKPEQITHWRHMPAAPQEEKTERKK
ncbi:TPA: DUF551 domain-containing protein [Escherichia coli]|uniref:DUF551 domain-containing protein n=1 Tax=Escherichia coli TaxID=562 RepID=UPI000A184B6E|nr:DUF551 domain-containing protein [Escherichia coli]EFK3610978.1 DUF551 domain-containing protein [Escherichia coli]EGP9349599.1 DUF551 domain-containing protein [Escherichia coli]EGQ0045842.1 DUF551 domain-containing protein [Escherichia coli]EHO8427387.1 DUF551 domain-containing protein [Escherichia coli]MDT1390430.1 DUF551 domain-containing protein [Escherichia coli]